MSGPMGHWSPAEDAALHELSHVAQLVYLRGLRRFVDGQTGIVGLSRVVSRRALLEMLTVPGQRGRHSAHEVAPTEGMVRHALRALEDAGLVVPVPGYERRLVFRLPLALQGHSVPRMSNRMNSRMSDGMSDRMSGRGCDAEDPNSDAVLEGVERLMSDRMSSRMNDLMSVAMSDRTSEDLPIGNSTSACRTSTRALGAVCKRLRQEAGMLDAHPHRPELIALLGEGFDADAVVATANELARTRGEPPNVGYLVGAVRGRARDAQRRQAAAGDSASTGSRESVCDRNERLERAAREREGAFDARP